jgi:hypothetical protein
MATYLADHPNESPVVYVTDYTSGRMVRPSRVLFVSEITDRNTGERDYRAYLDEQEARAAAEELDTEPVTWDTVLAKAR